MKKPSALFSFFVAVLLSATSFSAHAQQVGDLVEFVVGANGTGTYMDASNNSDWEGAKGMFGWMSNDKAHAATSSNASIALVSPNNVWTYSGDNAYPLRCTMTDLQSIVGSTLRIYGGFIIESVQLEVRNSFDAVATETSTSNWFTVSAGTHLDADGETVLKNQVTATQNSTASEAAFTQFSAYTTVALTFERSAATTFSRDASGAVYVDCKMTVKVKKVKQSVHYAIYTRVYDSDGKVTEDRLLHKRDGAVNPDGYTPYEDDEYELAHNTGTGRTGSTSDRYFHETITQYVGEAPQLPGVLRRMGCIYGYDQTSIGLVDGGDFFVKVYYTVDDANLPFHYNESLEELKYVYTLRSNENRWLSKSNASATKVELAASVAFIGDPYNTIFYIVDGDKKGYRYSNAAHNFQYWDILLCYEGANNTSVISSDFFALKDHHRNEDGTYQNFYYIRAGSAGVTGATKTTDIQYYNTDATTGAVYITKTSNPTHNAFMLTLGERAENIAVTYIKYYKDGESTYAHQDFHDSDGGDLEEFVKSDLYVGDRIDLPKKYLHPFRHYSYYYMEGLPEIDPVTGQPKELTAAQVQALFTESNLVAENKVPAAWDTPDPVKGKKQKTVFVLVSWDEEAPFQISHGDKVHWYYLTLNGKLLSAHGHTPYSLEADIANARISPMHLWKFVRAEDTSIHLINRWFGDEYQLANLQGDYGNSTNNYTGYTGAMVVKQDADEVWSNKWELLSVTGADFGLRSIAPNLKHTSMNLCDRGDEGIMRYYSNNAALEAASRMHAYEYIEGTPTKINGITLNPDASAVPVGTLFGLKKATSELEGNAEDILVNPENYITAFSGYARIRFPYTDSKGKVQNTYLAVRANLAGKEVEHRDVITRERIRAWVTSATSTTDATGIFNLHGTGEKEFTGTLSAEGYNVNTAIAVAASTVDDYAERTVTIYPYGLGGAAICANKTANSSDLYLSYKRANEASESRSVLLEASYLAPTPCIIEPVTTHNLALGRIGGTGPSYASVYLPFDIRLPEGVTAYRATAIDEDEDKLSIAACTLEDRVLPANNPVILICEDGSVSGTQQVEIVGDAPSDVSVGANLFVGTHYNFTVPKVSSDFTESEHDVFRLFGRGSSGDGKNKNLAGFYPFVTDQHCNVPANRAYIDREGGSVDGGATPVSVSPQLFLMVVEADENDNTTAVRAVVSTDGTWDAAPEFYDLQGRRVRAPHGGTFIVRSPLTGESRKVYIK